MHVTRVILHDEEKSYDGGPCLLQLSNISEEIFWRDMGRTSNAGQVHQLHQETLLLMQESTAHGLELSQMQSQIEARQRSTGICTAHCAL